MKKQIFLVILFFGKSVNIHTTQKQNFNLTMVHQYIKDRRNATKEAKDAYKKAVKKWNKDNPKKAALMRSYVVNPRYEDERVQKELSVAYQERKNDQKVIQAKDAYKEAVKKWNKDNPKKAELIKEYLIAKEYHSRAWAANAQIKEYGKLFGISEQGWDE